MTERTTNTAHTVPIDEQGEIARFQIVRSGISRRKVVSLNIDGEATADYAVDVGGEDANGDINWFDNEETYDDTDDVSDAWVQSDQWLRIRVTDPAPDDNDATLLVSEGR